MCKASIIDGDGPNGGSNGVRDGNPGDDLKIGTNNYGMGVGTTKTGGKDGVSGCLTCLHTGTILTVAGISAEVRQALLLDDTAIVYFIETPGSHEEVIHDLVFVQGRPDIGQIPFALFEGCTAIIEKATVDGEMTSEEVIGEAAKTIEVSEDAMEMLHDIAKRVTMSTPKRINTSSSGDVSQTQRELERV